MRNGNKKTILILCLVVVLVVGLFIFVSQKTKKTDSTGQKVNSAARTVGDDFVEAMKTNNPNTAYALLAKNQQYNAGSQSEWSSTFSNAYSGKSVSYKFYAQKTLPDPSGVYKGKNPQVLTYIVTLDDDQYVLHLTIIQESNKWLITDYDSTPQAASS